MDCLEKWHRRLDQDKFQGMKCNDVRTFMEENWDTEGVEEMDLTDKNEAIRMLTYILRLMGVEQSKISRLSPRQQIAEVAEFMFRLNRAADPDEGLMKLVDDWQPGELYESRAMEKELASLQTSYVEASDPGDDEVVAGQALLRAYI